jgi:hypothetical protein
MTLLSNDNAYIHSLKSWLGVIVHLDLGLYFEEFALHFYYSSSVSNVSTSSIAPSLSVDRRWCNTSRSAT